jgi:succinate-semialdehyde dehydrogenase/glutarate-semialdehyde dehydrogenase
MSFTSVNPTTNETLQTFETLSSSQLSERIDLAHQAFGAWRLSSFAERAKRILQFAALLRQRSAELAQLITREMGKRISESRYEIEYCAKISEFYAHGAEKFLADEPLHVDGVKAYIHPSPLGVILGVMPWNFPFYQVVRFAAPNIMAGNTVLIKHASNVPQCAQEIERLFVECGLPDGVYSNLFIASPMVENAIADSRVRGVSLTGSERAGAAVAEAAGKNIKRSVLELGGNDPFIVLEDVEPEKIAELAVRGRTVNAGQSCVASKRFIVVEAVFDRFLKAFKSKMSDLRMGDPADEQTTLGPLATEQAAQSLQEQVQSAIDAGATLVLGGKRPDRPGAFFSPTILADVTSQMPTFDTELFGPVATVYRVKDELAAIALANNSSYGLGASVFTQDIERGRRVAEQIESGMVFLNQPTKSQAELPFGGIKNSGYGRELSHLGIQEFVNKKLIYLGQH